MPIPKRPLLRYPGGKWRIGPWIMSHFPVHSHYIEPYGGGASVLVRKPRVKHEVYNDLDEEVVNVFRVMQDPDAAAELIYKLKYTFYSRYEYNLSKEDSSESVEQARRTIVRTFMGFGTTGMLRRDTGFRAASFYENRSIGSQWTDHHKLLGVYTDRLHGVVIENRPALQVIKQQDNEDTLFYCDPPYVRATRYKTDIYKHEMTDADQVELSELLHQVEGMVCLSGYPSDLYDELYSDWVTRERIATATTNKGLSSRIEVLWMNPACSENLLPLFNLQEE